MAGDHYNQLVQDFLSKIRIAIWGVEDAKSDPGKMVLRKVLIGRRPRSWSPLDVNSAARMRDQEFSEMAASNTWNRLNGSTRRGILCNLRQGCERMSRSTPALKTASALLSVVPLPNRVIYRSMGQARLAKEWILRPVLWLTRGLQPCELRGRLSSCHRSGKRALPLALPALNGAFCDLCV
jgi:hypothetical protein